MLEEKRIDIIARIFMFIRVFSSTIVFLRTKQAHTHSDGQGNKYQKVQSYKRDFETKLVINSLSVC
jgi:hypothetical protein